LCEIPLDRFQYLTDEAKREKIDEIIDCEEGIAMATDALCQVTADEEEYARLTSLMKGELDWRSSMKDAKREGLMEGHNKASLEIARNLKKMGLPVTQIADGTGLSIETITQL
jgi:predicted transposase/invertase (TIGR01784 family)